MQSSHSFIILFRLLFCVFDVFMLYLFFHSMFKRRWKSHKFIVVYILMALLIFFINGFQNSILNLASVPFIFFILVISTFGISFNNAIAYTLVYFIAFSGGKEVAFALLNQYLLSTFPDIVRAVQGPDGIFIILMDYILGFLLLLFTLKYTKELNISNENKFSWYLLILPISSMFILSSFLYMDFPDSISIQFLMCSGAFLLYFSNTAVFIVLAEYVHVMEKMKYTEMYLLKSELELENFKRVEEVNKKNRDFLHDTHKFNSNIRMLALNHENSKIVELVDELEGKLYKHNAGVIYNVNPIFNAILAEWIIKCEELDIKLNLTIEKTVDLSFIDISDMISLFGNLLNNAVEATQNCKAEDRIINVKLHMGNEYILVFYIDNPYSVPTKKEGIHYLTTKKDKQAHGLGIGICKKLAEKYEGSLELNEENGIFISFLTLSTEYPKS